MRPSALRAFAAIPFALVACGSNSLGSGSGAIPPPDGSASDGGDADLPCKGEAPGPCYSLDCTTQMGTETCNGTYLVCPQGQLSMFQCFGGDCPVSPPRPRVCQDADGGLVAQECNAGIKYCPGGTVDISGDGGRGDTTSSDGGDPGGITCSGQAACYSSDCARIVSCTSIVECPIGTIYSVYCLPDGGPDGAADR